MVVGRDVLLFAGAFAIRAHSLNWRWPGAREFFRIVPSSNGDVSRKSGGDEEEGAAPVAPVVKPLYISKVNTALQFTLVGSCMIDTWLGWPGGEVVWGLGMATAGTTVASCVAYGRAYLRGELLRANR